MLLVALLAWGGTELYAQMQPSTSVLVTDSDGRQYNYPLNEDATHVIETSLGTNVIEIEDGSVHVEEASCPNLNCVHQGAISHAGQTIVCLPNELVVTIDGRENDDPDRPDVDTVAM
jgi:hypothetical protein